MEASATLKGIAMTSRTAEVKDMKDAKRWVRVWDPLVRLFHWSLAASFFGAWLLGDDGGALHQALGYAALGLVAFRLVWGVIGPRNARFSSFVPSPRRFLAYVRDMLAGRERRYLGHNPAGGVMIVALLAAVAATGLTGWMMTLPAYADLHWVEDVHETLAGGALALVVLHVAGVVLSSVRHRENLVRAMITGDKRVEG
jgi:cytochrome b